MTEDPVKDGGNWYQYCYSNPVNLVDPNGQSATAAVATWVARDAVIPEPSDAVVWKWVGYGIAIGVAVAVDAVLNNDDSEVEDQKDDSKRYTPEQQEVIK